MRGSISDLSGKPQFNGSWASDTRRKKGPSKGHIRSLAVPVLDEKLGLLSWLPVGPCFSCQLVLEKSTFEVSFLGAGVALPGFSSCYLSGHKLCPSQSPSTHVPQTHACVGRQTHFHSCLQKRCCLIKLAAKLLGCWGAKPLSIHYQPFQYDQRLLVFQPEKFTESTGTKQLSSGLDAVLGMALMTAYAWKISCLATFAFSLLCSKV